MSLLTYCRIFLLISCCWYSLSSTAQNLVQDGKFTDGVSHWQVLLSDPSIPIKAQIIEQSQDYGAYGLADNYINTSFVELDAQSAIQQSIPTSVGDQYVLTFAYAHRPNAGKKQLVVLLDQQVICTKTIQNSETTGVFKYQTVHFSATKKQSKLSFYTISLDGPEDQGILITDLHCEVAAEINLLESLERSR